MSNCYILHYRCVNFRYNCLFNTRHRKTRLFVMSTRLTFARYKQMRWYSAQQKMKLIDSVDGLLMNEKVKHKKHPGIQKPKYVEQPTWLLKTVLEILRDRTVSQQTICKASQQFVAYLNRRHPPPEDKDVQLKLQQFRENYENRKAKDSSNNLAENMNQPSVKEANKFLERSLYNWKPICYDNYMSLVYLVGKSIPNYSILYKIFQEIVDSDTNFTPKSLFDFGSGIGTVMWAASQFWVESIKEYYCVDVSPDMNEMSEYLIKDAVPHINRNYIYYRQFFPASPIPTYDIVVSAYSLFELPSQKARFEVILKLWQKTANYMIIVEHGSNAGFKIVNEARDAILRLQKNAYVVSPCPHDLKCPAYVEDNTTCNFVFSYLTLPIGETATYKQEYYSYVILKKGTRPEDSCRWPRIVKPVLRRARHVICRMCTKSGQLEEEIFTTWKSGKNTYRCARYSEWGDRLPVEREESTKTDESE